MAQVTLVQSKMVLGNGSSSVVASFNTLPTVGNVVVAHYGYGSSTANQASLSDNQSNSYTEIIEANSNDAGTIVAYWAEVTTSSGTFTITGSQGVTSSDGMWIAEYSNVDTSSPIDGTPGKQETTGFSTTAISATAGTASRADDQLVLGARLAATSAIGFTAGTVTERDSGADGTAGQYKAADAAAGSTGAKTATGTLASGDSVAVVAYLLKGFDVTPVFTVQPTSQTVATGSTASFTTTVTGATSYQWETQAPLSTSWGNVSGGTGGTSDDYTTPSLTRSSDSGRFYRLKATNSGGDTYSNTVYVSVTDIPTSYDFSGFVIGSNT